LEDITNRPIEEIIALYHKGYHLDTLQQYYVTTTPPWVFWSAIALSIITVIYFGSKIDSITKEIKWKCPGCLDKLESLGLSY